MSRHRWVVPAAAAVVLAWWLAAKIDIFRQLVYGPDLTLSLELSRSFITDGRWIYDPNYGFHTAIHNYYTILLFAPLTLWAHEYGLFVGAIALHAVAVAALWRTRTIARAERAFLIALYLGPMGYFVFDEPLLGFHPEDVFVPLTVLFALALANRRRTAAAVWAALIFLTKESGAAIIVSVWFLWRAVPAWPLDGWNRTAVRRLLALTAQAALLLAVLMGAASALLAVNGALLGGRAVASIRLSKNLAVLAAAVHEPSFWLELSVVVGATIAISLTTLFWRRRALGFAPLLVAAILPESAIVLVSDIGYRELPYVPLIFAAFRQVMIWGIAIAAGVFTTVRLGRQSAEGAGGEWRPSRLAMGIGAAFAIQTIVLALTTPMLPWIRWVPWAFHHEIRRVYPVTDAERRVLACAADVVPPGVLVGTDSYAASLFADSPVLYTSTVRPNPDPPELVACSSRPHVFTLSCPGLLRWGRRRAGWESASFDSLGFAGNPTIMAGVRECITAESEP